MPQRGSAAGTARRLERAAGVEPKALPALMPAELALAFSQALDLAEGRPMGHAQRVCFIASSLASEIGLSAELRLPLFYAALFHDVGVPAASAHLSALNVVGEDAVFSQAPVRWPEEIASESPPVAFDAVVQAVQQHVMLGAKGASTFDLPEDATRIIAAHHESWDGGGYTLGMEGDEIPLGARILTLADRMEYLVDSEPSPLLARRSVVPTLAEMSGRSLDPGLVAGVRILCRRDSFWLGLHDDHLAKSLLELKPSETVRKSRQHIVRYAEAMATVVDGRSKFTIGQSKRVAAGAVALANAIGLGSEHARLVEVAAHLQDIGHLGVPARIMGKADLLTVGEMHLLRRHPNYSQTILEGLPGAESLALWVGAHHERPDGKGYPEMALAGQIPLESRILAVATVYAALVSERPYRKALDREDALEVLRGAAGTQLDGELVDAFCPVAADIATPAKVRRGA